jgi:hypothetical protein
MITAITIIDTMKKWVEEKHPISPATWLDASLKINILRSDFDDRYFELESALAQEKAQLLMQPDTTVARADASIKASPAYLEMRKIGAQIKMIEEMIRIAKKYATLKDEEYRQGQ